MTTYADQVRPYINFESKDEMDKHFNFFRKKHRFDITEKENKVLFTLNGFAFKFPGACKIETEKIAKAAGVSLATVKRAVSKAEGFGMLKRFKTRKENGRRQGVTVYQFQRFELELEPQTLSDRPIDEMPCDSKGKELNFKPYALILLLPSLKKSLKNITYPENHGTVSSSSVSEEIEKPVSLRQKIARQLKVRGLSLTTLNEFAKIAYGQIKKLVTQDASIPKTYAEDLVYKKFMYVLNRKSMRNPFGLFSSLVEKEFAKLLGQVPKGEQCELELQAKRGIRFRAVPDWMIEQEQDPARKARLIKNNEIARMQKEQASTSKKVGVVPDWLRESKELEAKEEAERQAAKKAEQENTPEIDFEAERVKLLLEMGYDRSEI
ncbi:hypothetical protein [Solibacillus isronensis]|uniref:hypothetical protein n=1 Tax=Solibacillus isronensis TaxID=412383 RepID=UPI0039A1763F